MYEAPDRYKRLISARLPGGESAGLAVREAEAESSPLRDVQLISRAQLAPFFAIANVVAALMMIANLWDVVSSSWLLPWAVAVGGINLVAMQLTRHQSITCVGRSGRRVPTWMLVGDVAVRAFTFLSVPLYLFPTLDPGTQVIAASVMAGLGIRVHPLDKPRAEDRAASSAGGRWPTPPSRALATRCSLTAESASAMRACRSTRSTATQPWTISMNFSACVPDLPVSLHRRIAHE